MKHEENYFLTFRKDAMAIWKYLILLVTVW